MRTDQPIYLVLLLGAALFAYLFGLYALLGGLAVLFAVVMWMRIKYPGSWSGDGYRIEVKQGFREEAWVDYRDSVGYVSFHAEWQPGVRGLCVFVEPNVYSSSNYAAPLLPVELSEVLDRVAEGLSALQITSEFTDVRGKAIHRWPSRIQAPE
jgi:hypothetical protein